MQASARNSCAILRVDTVSQRPAADHEPLAYCEVTYPDTTEARRAQLDAELQRYCANDELAMVRLAHAFAAARTHEATTTGAI